MRVTDEETIDIVQMVLAGKVNKRFGAAFGAPRWPGSWAVWIGRRYVDGGEVALQRGGSRVCGADCGRKHRHHYGRCAQWLCTDHIHGGGRREREVFNINADVAAARIAAKLDAIKLILMTDIRGLLRDKDDEKYVDPGYQCKRGTQPQKPRHHQRGMIPKIDCCVEAVRRGVNRAHILMDVFHIRF